MSKTHRYSFSSHWSWTRWVSSFPLPHLQVQHPNKTGLHGIAYQTRGAEVATRSHHLTLQACFLPRRSTRGIIWFSFLLFLCKEYEDYLKPKEQPHSNFIHYLVWTSHPFSITIIPRRKSSSSVEFWTGKRIDLRVKISAAFLECRILEALALQ